MKKIRNLLGALGKLFNTTTEYLLTKAQFGGTSNFRLKHASLPTYLQLKLSW